MIKKGKIFVIEGTDASGKETQANLIVARLNSEGISSEVMSFPRYDTPTGNLLRRYLGKPPYTQEFGPSNNVNPKIASCLYAVDRYASIKDMEAIVSKGNNLFLNRYVESNMGHQGGKIADKDERSNFVSWLEELEYGNFGLPRPDKVFFLYMPLEVAIELRKGRVGEADGHESNPSHLRNAEQSYLELSERFNWTRVDCAPDKTLSSLRKREDISEEIYEHVINSLF